MDEKKINFANNCYLALVLKAPSSGWKRHAYTTHLNHAFQRTQGSSLHDDCGLFFSAATSVMTTFETPTAELSTSETAAPYTSPVIKTSASYTSPTADAVASSTSETSASYFYPTAAGENLPLADDRKQGYSLFSLV